MLGEKVAGYARALYDAHGDKAEAEAAQKMVAAEGSGQDRRSGTMARGA